MRLSLVDLSTLGPDDTRHDALMHSIEMAQYAENLGFHRIWVAEHHGAEFVAGRAPEVLIAAMAANTKSIRIGSGSVLLNQYSPLKVVEVFCTLNELYPNRVDLGAGRATTGQILDFALQRDRREIFQSDSNEQIAELVSWLDNSFPEGHPFAGVPVFTLEDRPQLHLLGSSGWSAGAAAALGLRYVFAGFINQLQAADMISSYRRNFRPSEGRSGIESPEVILAVHAVCADSEEEARRQLAPVHLMYRNLSNGIKNGRLPGPDGAVKALGGLPPLETYQSGSKRIPRFIGGTADNVRTQLNEIANDFGVEEMMIQDMITDFEARKHSVKLLSGTIG